MWLPGTHSPSGETHFFFFSCQNGTRCKLFNIMPQVLPRPHFRDFIIEVNINFFTCLSPIHPFASWEDIIQLFRADFSTLARGSFFIVSLALYKLTFFTCTSKTPTLLMHGWLSTREKSCLLLKGLTLPQVEQ